MTNENPLAGRKVLFLGDCNTLGTPQIEGHAYPDVLSQSVSINAINCGHTMCTVREGTEYFNRYFDEQTDIVCLQYGLVDAWQTFRYSPYVLYFPDSSARKLGRKLTKKFKKWCKALGLNSLIGTQNVVPIEEYCHRISTIAKNIAPKSLVLIETVPNKETYRNADIQRYNAAMHEIARQHSNCTVLKLFDEFDSIMSAHYCDPTHIDVAGHQYLADKLRQHLLQLDLGP